MPRIEGETDRSLKVLGNRMGSIAREFSDFLRPAQATIVAFGYSVYGILPVFSEKIFVIASTASSVGALEYVINRAEQERKDGKE